MKRLFRNIGTFFNRMWLKINSQWILIIYLCAMFLRKRAIYKKFLNTIHYLINYELQPYRIVVFQSPDRNHYAEYCRWGYEIWWDPIISPNNEETKKLMEEISMGAKGIFRGKVIELGDKAGEKSIGDQLSYKNFIKLREHVRAKLGIEKGIKETYYDFGIELYQEAGKRFGIKDSAHVDIKLIFSERLCKATNCSIIFFEKDTITPRTKFILDVLHGLMNDGFLYVTSRYQPRHSLRKINPEFNLTEKGKAFVTDFSEISNKSDEILKTVMDKIDIPGKSS
jgi:ribosomal protein S8